MEALIKFCDGVAVALRALIRGLRALAWKIITALANPPRTTRYRPEWAIKDEKGKPIEIEPHRLCSDDEQPPYNITFARQKDGKTLLTVYRIARAPDESTLRNN